MASAPIGEIPVLITGDWSDLESAIEGAASAAEAGAATIADSFTAAGAEGLSSIAEGAREADQSMGALAESMQAAGAASGQVAQNVEEIPPALHDVHDTAGEAQEKLQEFLETGLELAGITLAVESLKEALISCIEAFGEFQRAGEALGVIAGDADKASEALEKIPGLANKIGQSIPDLETATVKFARFGVELDTIPDLLTAISDAARGSLQSFDAVASAFERMDNTGKVMGKTLQAAGLNMQDIAEAMNMIGASDKDIQTAFKNLGDGEEGAAARAEVLIQATQRVAGISVDTANDVTGSWQQIQNQIHDAAVGIGESLALLGSSTALDWLKNAIKGIETFVVAMIGYLQQAQDAVSGFVKFLAASFIGVGNAMVDVAKGNFGAVWADLAAGGQAAVNALQASGQQMVNDWTANGKIIDKIWGDSTGNMETTGRKHIQGVIDDTAKVEEALAKLAQNIVTLQNNIPQTEDAYLTQLQQGGEKATQMLSQINSAIAASLKDMQNLSLSPAQIAAVQAGIDDLNKLKETVQGFIATDDLEKLGDKIQKLADKFPEALSEMDPAIQSWAQQMMTFSASMKKAKDDSDPAAILENLLKMQDDIDKIAGTMAKSWQELDAAIGKPLTKSLDEIGAFSTQTQTELKDMGKNWQDYATTVQTSGAKQGAVFEMLKALKIEDIGLDQQQLKAMEANLATMQQMRLPLSEQLAVQADILTKQLAIAQAEGATADQALAWQEQLTAVQIKQNLLKEDTIALANLYKDMVGAFGKAWNELGTSLGDAIAQGKGFGAAMTKVFDDLKKQLAELVTNYLLGELKRAFLENTDAVNSFGKVFNSIFGGGPGGGVGSLLPSIDSFDKAVTATAAGTVKAVAGASDAVGKSASDMSTSMQQTAKSVQSSAASMVSGLEVVATVVGAIASIFSAIELAHTNTLLARIEESTRYIKIWTGEQSQSLLWCAQTSTMYLGLIHADVVNMLGNVEAIDGTLKSMLGVLAAGGGSGGGAVDFQALQKEINDALSVFKEDVTGPYGFGPMVQGIAGTAGSAASGLSAFASTASAASLALSTVTASAVTAAANVNTLAAAVTKAAAAATPATPGSNTMAPVTAPGPVSAGPASLGYNTMVLSGGPSLTVNVTAGAVVGQGGMQQLATVIQNHIVARLQTQGIRVTRG